MSRIFLTEDKLEDLLVQLGVKIVYKTATDIIAYCPFHDNRDSPAFNISRVPNYLWKCWNGKCNHSGNIVSLLTKKGYTGREAKRMLLQGAVDSDEFVKIIQNLMKEETSESTEWVGVDPEVFRNEDADHGYPARQYLQARGISSEAYDHFRMGYSHKKRMLVIPVFDHLDRLSGVIGRSIENKRYQYSNGLNRSGIIWGLNFAKHEGDDIALCEGALDAVRLWESGVRCSGAILGSAVSREQWHLLRTYFNNITCFFDNDEAGDALRDSIVDKERSLGVSTVRYPSGAKDPGELSNNEVLDMWLKRRTSLETFFKK